MGELKIVARCSRCGREFLALPSGPKPWVDRYFPQNQYLPVDRLPTFEECGGEIVPLNEPQP